MLPLLQNDLVPTKPFAKATMRPLFTVHAGEYLVGAHIEQTHPKWRIWIPAKDTGVDLLLTDSRKRKMVSLQVKFSKDFNPTNRPDLIQNKLRATGWWTHQPQKIQKSEADFWVFVLPSFMEGQTSFIIIPPSELFRRFQAIHGRIGKTIHSFLSVTKTNRCWEVRDLPREDQELLVFDRFSDKPRNFTEYLNAWQQIERRLK
jgi:hypothetical protein